MEAQTKPLYSNQEDSMKLSISVSGTPCQDGTTTTCRTDLEVGELDDDTESRIRLAIRRCVQAVGGRANPSSTDDTKAASRSGRENQSHSSESTPRLATEKQIGAIKAIARRKRMSFDQVLDGRFGVATISELTIKQASSVIDELKQLQEAV